MGPRFISRIPTSFISWRQNGISKAHLMQVLHFHLVLQEGCTGIYLYETLLAPWPDWPVKQSWRAKTMAGKRSEEKKHSVVFRNQSSFFSKTSSWNPINIQDFKTWAFIFSQMFLGRIPTYPRIWIAIIHAGKLRVFAFCLMYMISYADPSKLQWYEAFLF